MRYDFRSCSEGRGDDGRSRRHAFDDHQSKGLGLDRGVHDDIADLVERADLADITREYDRIGESITGEKGQVAVQFYGANRAGAKVTQGILDQFWLWSMQAGDLNAYESVKAFSETDFNEDLRKFDFPTLVLHGEDDQIVPVKDSAKKSAKVIRGAKEIYYPGAPHGLTATHQDRVNADLLAFLQDSVSVGVEKHAQGRTADAVA